MEEKIKINLNNYVYVKLSEKGIDHYLDFLNFFRINSPNLERSYVTDKIRDDGFCKMQMWEFVNIFGNLGTSLYEYVNVNILIDANNQQQAPQMADGPDKESAGRQES